MAAYYNEWDPDIAEWLRELIKAGVVAQGDVDNRDIRDVSADDLRGYTQCHFFAGIGGWSAALRLAGWPDDRPVWTGSCPCQDFSTAGPKTAQLGERHLWPDWFRLIRERRPPVVFGEQVAGAIAAGWLDDAFHDLESEKNACAAAVLSACCVEAPHERDRLWFVSYPEESDDYRNAGKLSKKDGRPMRDDISKSGCTSRIFSSLALPDSFRSPEQGQCEVSAPAGEDWQANCSFNAGEDGCGWLACSDGKYRPIKSGVRLLDNGIPANLAKLCQAGFGNAIVPQVAAEFIKASWECIA
jgi:DNA (cytosine-5)-methyltransferase 1